MRIFVLFSFCLLFFSFFLAFSFFLFEFIKTHQKNKTNCSFSKELGNFMENSTLLDKHDSLLNLYGCRKYGQGKLVVALFFVMWMVNFVLGRCRFLCLFLSFNCCCCCCCVYFFAPLFKQTAKNELKPNVWIMAWALSTSSAHRAHKHLKRTNERTIEPSVHCVTSLVKNKLYYVYMFVCMCCVYSHAHTI